MGVLSRVLRGGLRPGQHRRGPIHATKKVAARALLMGACGLFYLQAPAWAQSAEVRRLLPAASAAGQARLTYWGFEVYDASLWVAPGFRAGDFAAHAFALELSYLRAFSAADIARRSIDEMARA